MNRPRSANKFLFFFILYYIFLSITLSLAVTVFDIDEMLLLICQDFLLILLPVLLYMVMAKRKLTDIVPVKKLDLKNILYIIGITVLAFPLISLVSNISSLFFTTEVNDSIVDYISSYSMTECIIAFALIPAVFEEILCRGVLLSNYKTTSPIAMYVLSGIGFGMIHMNIQQMSYAIVAGIMLAFFVHQTNSIFASMLSHFSINASQVFFSKLILKYTDYSDMVVDSSVGFYDIVYMAVIAAVLSPFLVRTIKSFMLRNAQNADDYINNEAGTDKKFIDMFFVLSIILFLLFALILEFLSKR